MPTRPRSTVRINRRGLTLVELLIATAIMALMAAALGTLAMAVQETNDHAVGVGTATQHARVSMERMQRAMNQATASENFPGFVAFSTSISSWEFPDTLVVWRPEGAPASPTGLPRFDELVIFCPDPDEPNRLLEITTPTDTRTVPDLSDAASWQTELAAIKSDGSAERVQLTDLLRTAMVTESTVPEERLRGVVRFYTRVLPSEAQWQQYQDGSIAWEDIHWPQGRHGSTTGVRQAWCRFEFQLVPLQMKGEIDPGGQRSMPFFGSAAIYYELSQ